MTIRGRIKEWNIDAAITEGEKISSLFEYVSPSFNSIAASNLKLGDIRAEACSPKTVVVLPDYEATKPQLRNILSSCADAVIPQNAEDAVYRRVAGR